MLILSQVGYAWIRPFLIVLSSKQNIFDHLWCYLVQNGYSFSGRDQDVVIEFLNHVIFHDWAHFRGRALLLKSGGCKILRWWGYHHQIWSNDIWIWMMIWWAGHHHQIWSDGACYALEKRRYHLFPQEWICDFLIALNRLSIFIYKK